MREDLSSPPLSMDFSRDHRDRKEGMQRHLDLKRSGDGPVLVACQREKSSKFVIRTLIIDRMVYQDGRYRGGPCMRGEQGATVDMLGFKWLKNPHAKISHKLWRVGSAAL